MNSSPVALVTGASQGLGRALAAALVDRGWDVIVDARNADRLTGAVPSAIALPGDVTDAAHRADLVAEIEQRGRLDLLVNNASYLGPSPLPMLRDFPADALRAVFETNVLAPIALAQPLLPYLRAAEGILVNVSSDAAVEAYPGWGGYGAAKAALDHISAVLGAEEPAIRSYAVDPGDMRTEMHQRAFPGEDISDRPEPAAVVPAVLHLLDARPPSGRYRAAEWTTPSVVQS
jgi:NAD(P)-dependent dehydrogenase (short-subunit alcohol dehydrogenase family)